MILNYRALAPIFAAAVPLRRKAGIFFETFEHGWLIKFIEHRVADKAIVRLICKWLNAGVLKEGRRTQSVLGTVQGRSISPLLANIYLHYVFDLWGNQWLERHAPGRRGHRALCR